MGVAECNLNGGSKTQVTYASICELLLNPEEVVWRVSVV